MKNKTFWLLILFFFCLSPSLWAQSFAAPADESLSVADLPENKTVDNGLPAPPPASGQPLAPASAPVSSPVLPAPPPGGSAYSLLGAESFPVDIIKAIGAFLLVLALLLIALKLLGRMGRFRGHKGTKTFHLRGTLALDQRRYLAAVEIDNRLLVVGVSPEGLSSLGIWPLEEDDDEDGENVTEPPRKPLKKPAPKSSKESFSGFAFSEERDGPKDFSLPEDQPMILDNDFEDDITNLDVDRPQGHR